MIREVAPAKAKALLHSPGEIAFLDLREAGQFGEGHPLFAVPCPFSRLEAEAPLLVPNPRVPVLLIDAGDGVAERAAGHLSRLGYEDLRIVAGGAPGWEAAGLTLFKGVNVPSKILGELAEHVWRPRTVDAATFREWQARGEARLFDGRPPAEFAKMHVPGARCLPNGELAHRFEAVAGGGSGRIVVGCAGRTRGLVGAIGLKLAGAADEVYALEDGTQGWALSGLDLERGVPAEPLPELGPEAREAAGRRAADFLARQSIPVVTAETVAAFLADPARTTFVFDVRSEPEVASDPIANARHAPSGQIVQASDGWIGVRRARTVLVDDLGLRAGLAAFWLRQMGFETMVALVDDALRALPAPAMRHVRGHDLAVIGADEALSMARAGQAWLVDLRPSGAFRRGHADGALWAVRARLSTVAPPDSTPVLLVADDPAVLMGAARDFGTAGVTAFCVTGGHDALMAAGAVEVASPDTPSDAEAIDFLRFVHDRHDGNLDASRRYLEWERGLVAQLDAAERAEFRMEGPEPV